ncbi:MAG: hypothetical protein KDD76_03520 [Rickettsiales bacterium]|nr:hypothetical protein [Rickettsiales bacterium]
MKNIKKKEVNAVEDIDALFKRYLDICNQAIEKHKDETPYKQIMAATGTLMGSRPIDLAVYDDEPKAAFSLYFKDDKLKNGGHPKNVKKAWRVNLSYLKQVVEHPEKYIAHPERLDLDWLKSRWGF